MTGVKSILHIITQEKEGFGSHAASLNQLPWQGPEMSV